MAQDYKGYKIPEYPEMADAIIAFQAFVDSLPPRLPDSATQVGRLLQAGAAGPVWGPQITTSTNTPSGGSDGDLWLVVG